MLREDPLCGLKQAIADALHADSRTREYIQCTISRGIAHYVVKVTKIASLLGITPEDVRAKIRETGVTQLVSTIDLDGVDVYRKPNEPQGD
jgi:hypothetical protein